MRHFIQGAIACVFTFMCLSINVHAAEESTIKIRPHIGLGNLGGEASRHTGIRLLLNASETKKYGVEFTRIFTQHDTYLAAGILLEDLKFGWFNTSIGTIGYYKEGPGGRNFPGLVANLGWEPTTSGVFKPFIVYRVDTIFADKTLSGMSLSAGMSAAF